MPICSLYSLFIYKVFLIPVFTNIQAGVAPLKKSIKKNGYSTQISFITKFCFLQYSNGVIPVTFLNTL